MKYCNVKEYFGNKINNWYANAALDYGIDGRFIDATYTHGKVKLVWEEEGTRYAMELNACGYQPEELYCIWMESDWEEEAA